MCIVENLVVNLFLESSAGGGNMVYVLLCVLSVQEEVCCTDKWKIIKAARTMLDIDAYSAGEWQWQTGKQPVASMLPKNFLVNLFVLFGQQSHRTTQIQISGSQQTGL